MARRWIVRCLLVTSAATLAALFLGCMSLSVGQQAVAPDGEVLAQQGKIEKMPSNGELEVFYPVPYASPPNLELTSEWDRSDVSRVELLEQHEDRFRIRSDRLVWGAINWKARGVRRPAAQFTPAPAAVAPPPGLPDRPVPVEKSDK